MVLSIGTRTMRARPKIPSMNGEKAGYECLTQEITLKLIKILSASTVSGLAQLV